MRPNSETTTPAEVSRDTSLPTPPAKDAPLIEWARWHYHNGQRCGYRVTAVLPGKKKAYLVGWSGRPFATLAEVEAHWTAYPNDNTGLVPADDHYWLDVDNLDVLEEAEKQHGKLPSTYTQWSLNSGLHLLLKGKVSGSPTVHFNGRKLGEIRGPWSGQCVGAGSRGMDKDGKPGCYEIEELAPPADAPDWVMKMIGADKGADVVKLRPDELDVIEETRLRGLLALTEPFHRDDWLKVGFAIRDGEVINDKLVPLEDDEKLALWDEWSSCELHKKATGAKLPNPHAGNYQGYEDCENAWNSSLKAKGAIAGFGTLVHLAQAYALNRGVTFPEDLGRPGAGERAYKLNFKPVEGAESEPAAANGELVKPEGLFDGPEYASRPEAEWIIPDVLQRRSYSVASGRSQSGKSFNELALALSIVTGKPWLGLPIAKTGTVLYVAAEGQERIWKDVLAWCAVFGVLPESLRGKFFIFDRSARLNTDEGRKALKSVYAWIEHTTGSLPTYAVFDTLRRNMKGDVSDATEAAEVLHEMDELVAGGIAVTLIAHHGRGHSDTKGVTDWEDDADQARIYHGKVKTRDTKIEIKKVKGADDGWFMAVTYKQPEGHATLVAASGVRDNTPPKAAERADAPEIKLDLTITETLDKAVVEELANNPLKEWSHRSFSEHLAMRKDINRPSSTVRKWLVSLRENKLTVTHRRRLYSTSKQKWRHQT